MDHPGLSILFTEFDFSHHFHVDHIYPQGLFSNKKLQSLGLTADVIEKFSDIFNYLPNLQLLESTTMTRCQQSGRKHYGLTKQHEQSIYKGRGLIF